ncbi:MAG: cytidine deaminase [Thermus sp.]
MASASLWNGRTRGGWSGSGWSGLRRRAVTLEKARRRLKTLAERAYAPYSRFPVAALVVSSSGRVYAGVNVENASFPLSLCAERSAVAAMVAAGERAINRVYLYSPQGPIPPCGACRQVLAEFALPGAEVVALGPQGVETRPLAELLPWTFRLASGIVRSGVHGQDRAQEEE